jgi:succinoglycan biosynthesis transport protein ExoP
MSDVSKFDSTPKLGFEDNMTAEDAVLRAAPDAPSRAGYPSYPQPQGGAAAGGEPHLLDYVRVLYKRRWIAGTAFTVVMLLVTVYTFTVTPIYQASSKLLIESDNPNIVSFKEVINEEQAKADYYTTQYNILQSRTLARRTLAALKLWDYEEFAASKKPGIVATLSGGVMSLLGRKPQGAAAEAAIPDAGETAAQSKAIDAFLKNLTVSPVRNSRIVDIKFESKSPDVASNVVNALAKGYIDQNLEFKFLSSKEASDWLGDRLGEQRKQVEAAESKLQQYREQNDAISMKDRENIVVQKLSDLNTAVTQAKTERFQKEALYNQLQSLRGNSAALDTYPAIIGNTFIQNQKSELLQLQSQYTQLAEKLGDKHPDIIKIKSAISLGQAKLDAEIGKVVQSVKNEYQAALFKENSLNAALNQQKNEALTMNRKAIDYGVLDRDVQSTKQMYDSLMQRAKETGVSTELRTSNIRVVDAAERPRKPASPQKALNLLLGTLGGLMLGVGLGFFFEYLDSHLKTPDELQVHLGMPSLGMLPAIATKELGGLYPLLGGRVTAGFTEAFRAVRTNIIFSSADEGTRTLVVTSTGPGEGKTTFAVNLAVSLAQTGQRVLVIDGDMRKPKVHTALGITQEPGLSNVMVGTGKAADAVRKSKTPGLWILPAGKIPPNPAELLGSQRCNDLMTSLKQHFDWIIVDSPPVMAVIDAAVIAHRATGVVFLVGADMTSRHAAKAAIAQLANAQAKFVGAVLNRVELEKHHYYYSQYYKKEYGQYYAKTGTGA